MAIVIGSMGSDAGWWILDESGLHHVGGWNPEMMRELGAAVAVLREATAIKTPGVAEAVGKAVQGLVEKQVSEHLEGGGVVVLT
jgi:hypothetical protein